MAGGRKNTRRMHKLRDEFYAEGQRLDRDPATRAQASCWLCPPGDAARIDYTVPAGTTDNSHALDHFFPVEKYPELQEDWDNFRHAHRLCNERRGDRAPRPGLGETVPDWW